jgi:hypothetical protein
MIKPHGQTYYNNWTPVAPRDRRASKEGRISEDKEILDRSPPKNSSSLFPRLINGMVRRAPEVTVRIDKVQKNTRTGNYELYIGKIVEVRHWDRRRERPAV